MQCGQQSAHSAHGIGKRIDVFRLRYFPWTRRPTTRSERREDLLEELRQLALKDLREQRERVAATVKPKKPSRS